MCESKFVILVFYLSSGYSFIKSRDYGPKPANQFIENSQPIVRASIFSK